MISMHGVFYARDLVLSLLSLRFRSGLESSMMGLSQWRMLQFPKISILV